MKRLLVCQSNITYHVTDDRWILTTTASKDVIDENKKAVYNLNEAIKSSDTEEPLKDGKYYLAPFISFTYIRRYHVSPIFNQIISSIQKKLLFVLI